MNLETMKAGMSGDPDMVKRWHDICDKGADEERQWVSKLRAQGFKAAHPNDGRVDRKHNVVRLSDPQFNDGAGVGDLVMLGWPLWPDRERAIRLTKEGVGLFGDSFEFEDAKPKGDQP